MTHWGNAEEIRKAAVKIKQPLWSDMRRMVPDMARVARAIYPLAVQGLEKNVDDLHSSGMYQDEDTGYHLSLAARRAFNIGTSGFFINFFSPARRNWSFIAKPERFASGGDPDEKVAKDLDALTEASRYVLYHAKGYREINVAIKHLFGFGYCCILCRPETEEERLTRGRNVFMQTLRLGTYAMGVDAYGEVNRVVRHLAYSAEQLIQMYGKDDVPEQVRIAYERGDSRMFRMWTLIEPHEKPLFDHADKRRFVLDYEKFAYRSISWLDLKQGENEGVLEVAGYTRKPFVAARMEFELGDVYGRGKGIDTIGLVDALQTICEDCLDISGQQAQPAMVAPESLRDNGGLRLGRGDTNYVADNDQANAVVRALREPASSAESREEGSRLEREIKDNCYNNEFASINMDDENNPVRTATEIEYRKRQSLEQLSGAATTLEDELMGPIATIMRDYAVELGIVELEDPTIISKLNVKFESAVHKAMNAPDVNSRNEGIMFALQLAKYQLENGQQNTVLDNFDLDAVMRAHYRNLGAPEKDLAPLETRSRVRAERAANAAEAAAPAQEAAAAEIDKNRATAARELMAARQAAGGDLAAAMAGLNLGGVS